MESPLDSRLTDFDAFKETRLKAPAFVSGRPSDPAVPETRRPPSRRLRLTLGTKQDRDAPLVSCLMPTRGRFHLAKIAVGLFRRQTWPNKELVVVLHGGGNALADWIASLDDPTIRVSNADARMTLGELRNHSVAEARGHYICQWDDDDLSHPARIEAQMGALLATRSRACLFSRVILWFPRTPRLAFTEFHAFEGTLLCEKAAVPHFPALSLGEDTPTITEILKANPFVLLDVPELYVYVAHGSNTWRDAHMERFWQRATRRFEGETCRRATSQLSGVYPLGEYLDGMAQTGVAAWGVAPPWPSGTTGYP